MMIFCLQAKLPKRSFYLFESRLLAIIAMLFRIIVDIAQLFKNPYGVAWIALFHKSFGIGIDKIDYSFHNKIQLCFVPSTFFFMLADKRINIITAKLTKYNSLIFFSAVFL